jgi:formate/nitrite transporter FocA (FNT family)
MFTQDGIFNFHKVHIWVHANPHAIQEARHQTTFSVNVWAGIFGDWLICLSRLPERLTGPTYQEFLE